MFLLGIFIHISFLYSIFDIYFKSPIVKNVVPYQPQHHAVADRLVLFVVDGLRAESLVNYTTMKYLRSVANTHGRWGISHTQVPTESRPGHVALIAGFYEDPSAVFKGWKENPVDFDSVFNQSTYTWSWGTYDIVNIFTKGNPGKHIFVQDFDPYAQSFSTDKNTTQLDAWVFKKVKRFFENAKFDVDLQMKLHKKKIIFFLHLLGTDTAGHTHKPKTSNFLSTISYADKGIKNIEQVIRNFYNDDGRTTFLMTSDHGMTDWGSHGSGDNHETETPYVIWGSGILQPKHSLIKSDPETLDMSLDHRLDLNQVDLAPLMSTILSIPVPVNSIGKPINGLLNMTLSNKAKAIYSISRQLASQYDKKRQDVEANALPLLYIPYKSFTKEKYKEMIIFTEKLLKDQDYEELIVFSKEIVHLSLSGLRYYHDYYQRPLLILVTLSFLGWAACLLRVLLEQKVGLQETTATTRSRSDRPKRIFFGKNAVFLILYCLGTYLVYAQRLPIRYYVYMNMPLYLWFKALFPFDIWVCTLKQLNSNGQLGTVCLEVFSYTVGCLALGMSFTYRWTLSIPLIGMGLWPFLSLKSNHLYKPMVYSWSIGSLLLSAFAFMPVVGKDAFINLVLLAGFIWITLLSMHMVYVLNPLRLKEEGGSLRECILAMLQIMLLLLALYNIYQQSMRFDKGTPVNHIDQAIAWIIAVISPVFPLLYSKRMVNRLIAINTSLITFYLMMSVAHEGLFMVALTIHVIIWIIIEFSLLNMENLKLEDCTFETGKHNSNNELSVERSLSNKDFRRAFFFMFYIILAFFGTGNIASLNSFEIRWVTCFVTSFEPFLITTLVLLKTFAPFMVVGCGFVAVQTLTKAPIGFLNIIVLVYSNFMGIQLLYYVRNTGSWLEIGTSISQFVIVQLITLFIVIINKLAKLYTDVSMAGKIYKSRKKYV